MKVLVIEPCYINFGGYFRSFNLSLALSKKGIRVDLLVSSKGNNFRIKKTRINENFFQYELPRVNLHPYLNGRILRAMLGFIFGVFRKYNIIHACVPTQLESNIPAFLLKILGKKIVIDWDDYWIGSPLFKKDSLVKNYVNFCEKKSPRFFQNIVVVSDFLENKANEWGAKNVLKLINGVEIGQFKKIDKEKSFESLNLDKNKKYLLCFGNTYSKDRTLLLLQAFKEISKLDSNVMLICNFDPRKKILEENIDIEINEDYFNNIIPMGFISHRDLEKLFSIISATILLQGTTEDEIACFPIRIGSYLSGESVIIMNDSGSEASNTLKKCGCAIIERDINKIAEKTVKLIQNIELQAKLKEKVLKVRYDLSWDNQINKLISFYRRLLN